MRVYQARRTWTLRCYGHHRDYPHCELEGKGDAIEVLFAFVYSNIIYDMHHGAHPRFSPLRRLYHLTVYVSGWLRVHINLSHILHFPIFSIPPCLDKSLNYEIRAVGRFISQSCIEGSHWLQSYLQDAQVFYQSTQCAWSFT